MNLVLLIARGSNLIDIIVHWFIASFAWHAGSRIAGLIPTNWLIIIMIVVGCVYIYNHYIKND